MWISTKDMMFSLGAMLRGSLIGFIAGVLPGAGASLGSFVAYTVERRISNRATPSARAIRAASRRPRPATTPRPAARSCRC